MTPGFDPATRPRLSPSQSDKAAAASGHVLVQIHNHLRGELEQMRQAVIAVSSGAENAAAARSLINRMTMRQNYWSVGAFCAAYCRILTMHHAIEDQSMFTDLRQRDESLAPVLDRLSEEHEVIADLLDQLDRALVALVGPSPGSADAAGAEAVVAELAEVLLSHLSYEEAELVGPLERLGILV